MPKGNDATRIDPFIVNDRTVDIHITSHGSDWYWAVMSVMGVTMLAIIGHSIFKPRAARMLHYILATAALAAMVEHYSMAANLGWVPIDVEWSRPDKHLVAGVNRQIWWVRYCGWFVIWPLLTLTVLLTATMPRASIAWTCLLIAVSAIMALVGAVVRTEFKWGYYGFWIGCWFGLGYYLIWFPRRFATAIGTDVGRVHLFSASWIWFLWMIYPICWGLSEGGNVIAPDSEFIFYGILDCMLIPVSSAFLLWSHRNIDPARLGIAMRDFDDPFDGRHHGVLSEKDHVSNGNPATEHHDVTGAATNV